MLEETAEAVVDASNKVTSVAQKTAAKATKVAAKAEDKVEDAAETHQGDRREGRRGPETRAPSRSPRSHTVKAATASPRGQEEHPGRPQVAGQGHLGHA